MENNKAVWIIAPIDMSLSDAMAAVLMSDTLIRTQDGVIWRKCHGRNSLFVKMTRADGTPLASAKPYLAAL